MKKKNAATICMAGVLSAALLLGGCGNDKEPDSQGSSDTVEQGTESSQETESVQQSEGTENEEQPASGETQMWDGYYQDTSTGTMSFVRFNEDGSYYCSYFDKAVVDAGMWELLDEEMEYSVDAGPDGDANTVEDNTKATAAQVVAMTSYQSGETVKIAYVDDQLCDMSMAGLANHRNLAHDSAYAYNPATDETPIQLYVFYAGNSIGSNITLSHDRSFVDVTGDTFMDGTWEMGEAGVYSLTYSDSSEAVLTVDPSGKSAVLEKADGSQLELSYTFEEEGEAGAVVTSMRAEDQQVGLPMSVALRLDCLGDGTCQLIVEVAQTGQEMLVDQGTYTVTETYKYQFVFDQAGELESVPDYANASEAGLDMTLAYKADIVLEADGQTAQFNIDSVLEGKVTP